MRRFVLIAIFWIGCGGGGTTPTVDISEVSKDVAEILDVRPDLSKDVEEATCVWCEDTFEVTPEIVQEVEEEVTPTECPCPGCFGCVCSSNEDCQVYCVPTPEGNRCTRGCQDESDCPQGWSCKMVLNTKGDPIYVCLTSGINYCMPCEENKECASIEVNSTNRCVSYGPAGKFCGLGCGNKGDPPCPEGSSCQEVTVVGGATVKQCVPNNNECTCSNVAIALAASTTCFVNNQWGTCFGKRECLATGLTECSAKTPAEEVCDGVDNDCDGKIDPEGAKGCVTYYTDNDLDGYGMGVGKCLCYDPGPGYAIKSGDCNDSSTAIHPGAKEVCNGLDDDCDGIVDNENAEKCTPYLFDNDGDGWASEVNASNQRCLCGPDPVTKFTAQPKLDWDCDDTRPDVFPGAKEICDGLDNDCDGITDPEGSGLAEPYYYDGDGDGFGLTDKYKLLCSPDPPYSTKKAGDCNDQDPNINPVAPERCNNKDDNCNGLTDEGDPAVMCPPIGGIDLHGTVGCAQKCIIVQCEEAKVDENGVYIPGWNDLDGDYKNGCECQSDQWEQYDGHSCATAVDLSVPFGDFTDNGFKQVIEGNISSADDEDWYVVNATDPTWNTEPGGSDNYNLTVRFTQNPNKTFLLDIYRGTCAESNNVCKGGTTTEWATNFFQNGKGESPCSPDKKDLCSSPQDVEKCLAVEGTPARCGSCPGQAAPGANYCSDNSALVYIRVYRDSAKPATCQHYEIEIANGAYPYSGQ